MIKEMFRNLEPRSRRDEQENAEAASAEPSLRDINLPEPEEPSFEEPDDEFATDGMRAIEAAYCLGAGIDADTLARAKEILREITGDETREGFSPSALHLAVRLLDYDRRLEEARQQGIEEGRAERIADAFRDRRSRAEQAAAIPRVRGGEGLGVGAQDESIFDVARGALG